MKYVIFEGHKLGEGYMSFEGYNSREKKKEKEVERSGVFLLARELTNQQQEGISFFCFLSPVLLLSSLFKNIFLL